MSTLATVITAEIPPLLAYGPLSLLLAAALLLIAGLIAPRYGLGFIASAVVLMLAGTTSFYVVAVRGAVAAELAGFTP